MSAMQEDNYMNDDGDSNQDPMSDLKSTSVCSQAI